MHWQPIKKKKDKKGTEKEEGRRKKMDEEGERRSCLSNLVSLARKKAKKTFWRVLLSFLSSGGKSRCPMDHHHTISYPFTSSPSNVVANTKANVLL